MFFHCAFQPALRAHGLPSCNDRSDEFGGFFAGLYNRGPVVCPLCGQQKARRACPALGRQICAICCGTKRLTEIACPNDCVYLAVAREHPPAVAVRRHKHDVAALVRHLRDLGEQQSQLFFLIATFLLRYEPPELNPLVDEDVAEGMDALAATFETAARGVIYEHRAASLSAERLVNGLKPLLTTAGQTVGSAFQRDASVVSRRTATAARRDAGRCRQSPGVPRFDGACDSHAGRGDRRPRRGRLEDRRWSACHHSLSGSEDQAGQRGSFRSRRSRRPFLI